MVVLIDYDNIHRAILRRGIDYVISRVFSKINPVEMTGRHAIVRLYGGWYQGSSFTRRAQDLATNIAAFFPTTILLSDNRTSVIVRCEMAYSILADPTNHLFHTYRTRGIPTGLSAMHPSSCGCTMGTRCPQIETYNFITNDICSTCNTLKPERMLYRSEQKLVDTMLTSDLIYSSSGSDNLVLVSSDDDFWPGIKTTIVNGGKVIQIHTRGGRTTPSCYTHTTSSNYIQKQL